MKQYTVINNKTGYTKSYSWWQWNGAWWLVFIFGVITGASFFI